MIYRPTAHFFFNESINIQSYYKWVRTAYSFEWAEAEFTTQAKAHAHQSIYYNFYIQMHSWRYI